MPSPEPCATYLTHVRSGVKVYCALEAEHDGKHVTVAGLEWNPTTPHPKPTA